MKSRLPITLLSASLLLAAPVIAQSGHHHGGKSSSSEAAASAGELIPVTAKDEAWAAKERKSYGLTTCVVSGEPLGSMGGAAEYIYRVSGKPDRLVMFCCSGCEEDFMQDPASHLAKMDQARKSGGKKPEAGHGKH